jgi:HrpA-like RNA helicase
VNEALPIYEFRAQIVNAVRDNPVVIITAETGAGKSTQVPQYLLAEDYNLGVTQPRRLAARTVAARVAEELDTSLGELVGYRTAYERQDSASTRCLFATDGLALVRELMGMGNHTVLILDEVHEWNLNIEVLVAWAKRQVEEDASFRVVLMSATLEADRLSAFFNGAPVINVPGRLHPVTERPPAQDIVTDVLDLLVDGRNVLVFQPGKREIAETIGDLKECGVSAEILTLHGEMTPEEQAACFRTYGRPKCVVSTNVAQTSVTISDIDAVVDSGMERRVEKVDGVEGLYLKPISLADSEQRKGRAGRTKPGVYVDHCHAAERLTFPVAEILRLRLDQVVLRLAEAGIDAEGLEFFHQPDKDEIHEARRALVALGLMDENGQVTTIGRQVAKLPISVHLGRMIVEAERLEVVDDVVTIAAILEQGEITARQTDPDIPPAWRKLCAGEETSDVLAQLAVYQAAQEMDKDEMRKNGVFVKAYFQALERRRLLVDSLRGKVRFGSTGDKISIIKAVAAGMVDHLYQRYGIGFRNGGGQRELGRESVVRYAMWIVGIPWDLQIKTRRGLRVLHLIKMASRVEPEWLAEVAPQLVKNELRNFRYSGTSQRVIADQVTTFNGHDIETNVVMAPRCEEAIVALARYLAEGLVGHPAEAHNARVMEMLRDLWYRSNGKFGPIYDQMLIDFYLEQIGEATSLAEIDELPLLLNLETVAPASLRDEIYRLAPKTIVVGGQELVISYYPGHDPKVTLTELLIDSDVWRALPDAGLRLPDGRAIQLFTKIGDWTIKGTDLQAFKDEVRGYLNARLWDRTFSRPRIEMPRMVDGQVEVPPIVEFIWGEDALTRDPLVAFGTAILKTRYYRTNPLLEPHWFHNRADAEKERARVLAGVAEISADVERELRLAEAKEEAERLQREAIELWDNEAGKKSALLPPIVRTDLYYLRWDIRATYLEDYQRWIKQARYLIETARKVLKEESTKVAELQERVQSLQLQITELLDQSEEVLETFPIIEQLDKLEQEAYEHLPSGDLADLVYEIEQALSEARNNLKQGHGWGSDQAMRDDLERLKRTFS